MTAPTTREELVEWLAATMWNHWTKGESHKWDSNLLAIERQSFRDASSAVLTALDTFAVVCPRYPTPEIRNGFMSAGGKQDPEPVMHEFYSWYGDFGNFAAAWRYGTAASSFAPKEPTDG